MNVLGKIFALIALALMVLIIVNYKTIIPYFERISFFSGGLSPTDIGNSYIEEINKMYPMYSQGSLTGETATTYAEFVQMQQNGSKVLAQKKAKITVEKEGFKLRMTTENLKVPASNPNAHIWITNAAKITPQTIYIDFGVMKEGPIQKYQVTLQNPNVSLDEYKHVMIVNVDDYTIYGQSILAK